MSREYPIANVEDSATRINLEDLFKRVSELEAASIQVRVGSFICPASTGDYSVTGLDFKPRYIDFKVSRSSGARIYFGVGQMDYNGNQNAQAISSLDDLQRTHHSSSHCIYGVNEAGTLVVVAVFKSMNSDGYTITLSVVDANWVIWWKAIS